MTNKHGLPANVNPFCIVATSCLCDGMLQQEFPQYFAFAGEEDRDSGCGGGCIARAEVRTPALSQAEAEKLIRDAHDCDPYSPSTPQFAVKEAYAHIIPAELRKEQAIARTGDGQCTSDQIYFLI